jgi:hypothetical protein
MKKGSTESQRIYWQQWLSAGQSSRRELITSSAAIRISPDAAKASDVTKLLRQTLNLSSGEEDESGVDSLVLVGTLYSLPPDYVQFEHSFLSQTTHQSDPFHVVKTLKPDDNPLATRNDMMDHLKKIQEGAPAGRSVIAPKCQWFFVPSLGSSLSPIPSCIELDGYCTSREEEDYVSDDEDEGMTTTNNTHSSTLDEDPDSLLINALSLMEHTQQQSEETDTRSQVVAALEDTQIKNQDKEIKRYLQLSQSKAPASSNATISGYLLKQSHVDRHVWRRVHCTLTNDHLWYVSRIPYSTSPTNYPRIAKKHGQISLERALLLEPNVEYTASPLYKIPNAFEVVSSRGTSHIFRAPNRAIQRHWISTLSNKIIESFENSLLSHAELIVAEESVARNKRFRTLAVSPLALYQGGEKTILQRKVLNLGSDICEYREQCRHVQAFWSAKSPVVASSFIEGPATLHNKTTAQNSKPEMTPEPAIQESIDPQTKRLVQRTWDMTSSLLIKCTYLAMDIQNDNTKQLSRSLQVLCRHVEYVITGHRNKESRNPPPMDLFDLLLTEFQSLVVGQYTRMTDTNNHTTYNP